MLVKTWFESIVPTAWMFVHGTSVLGGTDILIPRAFTDQNGELPERPCLKATMWRMLETDT